MELREACGYGDIPSSTQRWSTTSVSSSWFVLFDVEHAPPGRRYCLHEIVVELTTPGTNKGAGANYRGVTLELMLWGLPKRKGGPTVHT